MCVLFVYVSGMHICSLNCKGRVFSETCNNIQINVSTSEASVATVVCQGLILDISGGGLGQQ